jgi:hypothetical protein
MAILFVLAPDGTDFLLLNGAEELGLEICGKFTDFVEKDGAAFGDGKQAIFGLVGAGKGAFDVPEELAFDELGHERAAVDGDVRAVFDWAGKMDGAGDHFLAGAAFSQDEDGMVAAGGLGDDAVEAFHFRRLADDGAEACFGPHTGALEAAFAFLFQMTGHAL